MIDKLKHTIQKEISNKIKNFAPDISIYLKWPQSNLVSWKNSIMKENVIKSQKLKNFTNSDLSKSISNLLKLEQEDEVEKKTLSFISLIDLIPFLNLLESWSDSYNSDQMYEEYSSDEVTPAQGERHHASDRIVDFPFPVFRYNYQNRVAAEGASLRSRRYEGKAQEEVENFLPYYLLINDYQICEKVSQALQMMFVMSKHTRIHILDQISFIMKEIKLENLDTPKRIVSLYNHIDMFLRTWREWVKTSNDENDFLTNTSQYENEKGYMKDLQIIIRLIETLWMCNLVTDSLSLKKISCSILKSAYEILKIINVKNKIDPIHIVINKILPLKKLIMLNTSVSEDTLWEMLSNNTQIFDFVLGKGFDKFQDVYVDKGLIPLLYIVEWIRIWTNMVKKLIPGSYSHNLLSYINKASKFKLVKSSNDINFEQWNKDNLKIFIALALYSNTILELNDEEFISELASKNSLFVKSCLSCLNEDLAIKFNKPRGSGGKVKIQHHVYWLMYLTSCHKFNNDQNPLELKTINNTLDLIKTLSHCLINREFGSDTDKTSKAQKFISKDQKSQISNFNEIQHQMEQDYLICIYLFYLFHDLNMMIQEKEMSINKKQVLFKISKIKVNTLLSKELELIIQVAINVCKNIHLR